MLRTAGADEAREGMQRRQSLIACRDAAGSDLFEVSEKVPDAVGRQIVDDIAGLVEALVDVWQTLGIPFIEPPAHLHVDEKSDEKCSYPEIKLAAQ